MDVAVLAPVSPLDPRDGHRLAVFSDVVALLDNKLTVGVIAFAHGKETNSVELDCVSKLIPARAGGLVPRLLRGLATKLPPSAERLYGSAACEEIRTTLASWRPAIVILDDSLVGGYVPMIREILPQAKLVLRSHNVMHDVRAEQAKRTEGLTKPFVAFDCRRFQAFERQAVESTDAHWAITDLDAHRMAELYGRPTETLTVSLPLQRYMSLSPGQGQRNGFVHVGTLDFRRRADLDQFLTTSWPKVIQADSGATLTLAGALHGKALPATNVEYSGRVSSDTDAYRGARFAVNFQSSTGGLKLKTLTSLAAGRTLISTTHGVEGLALESGRHYWNLNTFVSSPQLRNILEDDRAAQSMASAGREYVINGHSRAAVARQLGSLLAAL